MKTIDKLVSVLIASKHTLAIAFFFLFFPALFLDGLPKAFSSCVIIRYPRIM